MSVGVMRGYNLKLRDLHSSHTLGCGGLGHLKIETMLSSVDEKTVFFLLCDLLPFKSFYGPSY
jgi:hypothetical protein